MCRLIIPITLSIIFTTVTVCGIVIESTPRGRSLTSQHSTDVLEFETRREKGAYYLYPFYGYHGWHALTWIYWIKVKLVVVAFFAYTAFIWALRYFGSHYNKCPDAGNGAYYHGHYRAFDEERISQMLQTIKKSRKRRYLPRYSPHISQYNNFIN